MPTRLGLVSDRFRKPVPLAQALQKVGLQRRLRINAAPMAEEL